MSLVLPYDFNLEKSSGGIVTPLNKILYLDSLDHEEYSSIYCHEMFFNIDLNNINELKKRQYKLYQLWLNSNNFKNYSYLDFLIYVLGYDKIQSTLMLFDKTIITTSENPYLKYYNYYLMDWSIERQSKMIYNQEINEFVFINQDCSVDINMETKLELDEIKKKIIKKDRILFLK